MRYPYLGSGIGLRQSYYDELIATERQVDWVEFISENFMGVGGRRAHVLAQARARWPLIPHGVALDVGGREFPPDDYLEELAEVAERVGAPWFSDHLCYSRLGGKHTHELLPLPMNEEVADLVADRIVRIQDRVGLPFLLENPSFYALMPGTRLSESAFLTRIVERADCGLLLDLNNVYCNAENLAQYEPRAFVDSLPLERVGQVHLAGHHHETGVIIDSHSAPPIDAVWGLFRHLLTQIGPVTTLFEWDLEIPTLDEVLDEADKARAILVEHGAPAQVSVGEAR